MAVVFGFLPVLLFLFFLFLLDSFKLVRPHLLIWCLVYGIFAAGMSYVGNTFIADTAGVRFETLTRYIAPVVEEVFKTPLIIFLMIRRQIGFMVDAAIYGFAVGTGFALAENTWYYLHLGPDFNVLLAIVRGFGTALMHSGTISIFGIMLIEGVQSGKSFRRSSITGLLVAIMIHSIFNHFFINPMMQTMLIILILPLVFYIVFMKSNKHLQQWLEVGFSNEVDMLRMIRQGQFRNTRAGQYLASLREYYEPQVLLDIYCFFSLYLELSIKAKRNLMLRENGFPVIPEPDIKDKLKELYQLKNKSDRLESWHLLPLVRMRHRELWELNQLEH
jgi:protease PrsW